MKLLRILCATTAVFLSTAFAGELRVEVDATEISRALLHSKIEIPASPGELVVWYPKWIPGVHAPAGPVQNMAGLRFETAKGDVLTWRRDDEEMNRFIVTVPAGADRVIARLDYICNQPSVNSSGVDSYGNSLVGVINWNTVLLYPESAAIDADTATVRLKLPAGWKYGTALRLEKETPEGVNFAAGTLRRVVDSPLICGENFRSVELTGKNTPPTFLHLTSEAASAIQLDDKLIAQYRKLVAEAVVLFGGARFEQYHFLVVCSDRMPGNGLEHLESSFNVVGERDLVEEKKMKSWAMYLLPHEFVHSWCGKFRRPAAMVTTSFHRPERTRLLWVYEGLTQYLGEVLAVRSGLMPFDQYLPALANKLSYLRQTTGREWRPLDDTAAASWTLRAHSPAWSQLRRSQDYYDEGLVNWLEADALIREKTGGAKSLDDFCRKFFATARATDLNVTDPAVKPYELKEVIGILKELTNEDWDKFFADRITKPRPALSLDFLTTTLGYRLQFNPKPSEYFIEREKERKGVNATDSIGLSAADDGKIGSVIPGSAADKAGLASAMILSGVNGRKFSGQRLKDGIADSVSAGKIDLLVLDGDTFRNVTLPYADGPKYLELIRTKDHLDTLTTILTPVTKDDGTKK
jgi:predicted metalloprotease with PDZ domain